MVDETIGSRKRFESFFNDYEAEEDKIPNAYVYVLLDKGEPFYVGKGNGDRCFQHEDELNDKTKQKKEIEQKLEEYKKVYNLQEKDYEEIQKLENSLKKELSAKLDRIKSAKANNTFDIAIVKYGLTNQEAFMCESSVINILKFCEPDKLTNDINGHASPKEKEIKEKLQSDVQARIMSDFLDKCCPPQKKIQEIKDFVIANITTEKRTTNWNNMIVPIDDVAFISYNDLYDICNTDEKTWDAVRGHWYNVSLDRGESVKYIFAMHNTIVKGIYKVKRDHEIKSDFQLTIDPKHEFLPILRDDKQGIARKNESKVIRLIIKLLKDKPELRSLPKKKRASTIQEELKKSNYKDIIKVIPEEKKKNGEDKTSFLERGFWGCNYNDFKEDLDLQELKEQFLGCQIKEFAEKLIEIPQTSVLCLYRNNSKGKRKKQHTKN